MNRPSQMSDAEFLEHLGVMKRAYFGGVERRIAAGTKVSKKGVVEVRPKPTELEAGIMERITKTIEWIESRISQP